MICGFSPPPFHLFQSNAEDVLHYILLQSIHHHETDGKQVNEAVADECN